MEKTTKTTKKETAKKETTKQPTVKEATKKQETSGKVAVILIRCDARASQEIIDTLKMLNIHKKLACSVFDNTQPMRGMLKLVKDYTTFGEIDEDTLKLLNEKRGKKDFLGKTKKHYHLHPPRGGFERKGIKRSFDQGGAAGNRGTKINELIKRML